MNDNRRAILQMLSEGKVTADEAERLIAALETGGPTTSPPPMGQARPNGAPKYLRVLVAADEPGGGPTAVNVRVPIALLKAGVRLSSVIPPQARDRLNAELAKHGAMFDLNEIRPENLEELVDQLNDLTVDVEQEKTKVRVYCE
ncbi:MAG TPA: hypothetical protein VGL66_01370 [Caulobacteraceae bacterium]|jgi:hypothetical protein